MENRIQTVSVQRLQERGTSGYSLLEMLVVLVIIGLLAVGAGTWFLHSLRAAHEARAVANLRTMVTAQIAFHSASGRFATFEQLITRENILSQGFIRNVSGTGASEVISDGRYEYSFRFDVNAIGYTLDADPKPAYARTYRRFRYRYRNAAAGKTNLLLVAKPSIGAPPESSYLPFNP
ncbi:MAG: type II secretion system GspH family protein [Blastocatellia bacterium]|nr:type II secretion system GspH family protein [Blastocatellia bacterium]